MYFIGGTMPTRISKELIAPCGMNCAICKAYLRQRNPCNGCRFGDSLFRPGQFDKPGAALCFGDCSQKAGARFRTCAFHHRPHGIGVGATHIDKSKGNPVDSFVSDLRRIGSGLFVRSTKFRNPAIHIRLRRSSASTNSKPPDLRPPNPLQPAVPCIEPFGLWTPVLPQSTLQEEQTSAPQWLLAQKSLRREPALAAWPAPAILHSSGVLESSPR
jgi:hypothetical protein